MNLSFNLLDHPFYQAWSRGAVTTGQLARYARSYAEFIALMPVYWTRIGQAFGEDISAIVGDETHHISLWAKWSAHFPEPADYPRMTEIINAFENFTPSELLGAVHAFELQQPGVARTKKDGLVAHYGVAAADTVYFDEHIHEQSHLDFGQSLATQKAVSVEFERGLKLGAELIYRSLDLFVV